MLLASLKVSNFRCYETFSLPTLNRLAVLTGENDSGKTVLLDAITMLVEGSPPRPDDARRDANGQATEIEITGEFKLEAHDTLPEEFRIGPKSDLLHLTRKFTGSQSTTVVKMMGFANPAFDNFDGDSATRQKELLAQLGAVPGSNEAARRQQFKDLCDSGALRRDTVRPTVVNPASLKPHLPRIERVATAEYRSPDAVVQRTLQAIAASVLAPRDPQTNQPVALPELTALRNKVESELNAELEKAKQEICRLLPGLQLLRATPSFDFARAVTATPLVADAGSGEGPLSSYGEGTKKRIWMGLLDWEQSIRSTSNVSVIRLYDEPDVNLSYQAQRHLFKQIQLLAEDPAARTQCITCTHAVTFVDRAPSDALNLIEVGAAGARTLKRISSQTSTGALSALSYAIGREVGLTNSVLLYERAFLLVEGESEAASLPVLYKLLHGRTLDEDGLVIVNLFSCSAWQSIVQMMLHNRLQLTHMLLDTDCTDPLSSANLTSERLLDMGLDAGFVSSHVTFVGTKEFEDAFGDAVLTRALDGDFPRQDGTSWAPHIPMWRAAAKFSEEMKFAVKHQCVPNLRSRVTKPTLARAVAETCTVSDVPTAVVNALYALRVKAGLERQAASQPALPAKVALSP